MSDAVFHDTFPGMQGSPHYTRSEGAAVGRLRNYFRDPKAEPLLTIDEDDIRIQSDAIYFDAISRYSVPRDAIRLIKSGELTNDDIVQKQNAGRAIVRTEKAEMFAERIITATLASDTCRSLYRVATKGELVPVLQGDTTDTVTHRVGDYVTDLLRAGRETRMLRAADMLNTVTKLRKKFDTEPAVALGLTVLAGENSMRKIDLWLTELGTASRSFDRMTKASKDKLMRHINGRPAEYIQKPDLYQRIADIKVK